MFASALVTFRETLEAALVVCVILTFLTKTGQDIFKQYVWRAVLAGALLCIVLAVVLELFFSGFTGRTEQLFEGVLMVVTAGFLTWMIMWVHKQKDVAERLREQVAIHAKKGYGMGIFILVSTSVLREGIETVLYLKASSLAGASNQLTGAIIGIASALILGYALIRWAIRINLSLLFQITSAFLLLFGAGLLAHGIHEFQEAGVLPIFAFDPVFNISGFLDHKSTVGSILRVIFGYTSKPTLLELTGYSLYIVCIFWLKKITDTALAKQQA